MKIKNLSLQNFCNHEKSILEFDRINIIQGVNNSGKTAVADAIKWCLTGFCRNMRDGSDRAGELDLLRLNGEKMEIGLIFSLNGTDSLKLLRSRTKSSTGLKLITVDEKKDIKQDEIFRLLKSDERKMAAALDGMKYFLELDSKGRKQLLFDLLGVSLNVDLIKLHLEKHQIVEPFLSKVAEVVISEGFEGAKAKAEEKRRDFKRDLKALDMTEPENKKILFKNQEYNLASIQVNLLKDELKKLKDEQAQSYKRSGELSALEKIDVIKLDQQKMKIIPEIDGREEKLKNMKAIQEIELQIKTREKSKEAYEKELKGVESEIAIIEAELRRMDNSIREMESLGDECPKCHSKLSFEVIINLISKMKKEQAAKQNELKLSQDKKGLADKNLKEIKAKLNENASELNKRYNIEGELAQYRKELDDLNKQVKIAEKRSGNVEKELIKVNEKINALKYEIAELENCARQVEDYQARKKIFNENIEKKAKIESAIEIYDRLTKLLAPDGIINDILQSVLGKFQKRLNATNSILPEIKVSDDIEFQFGHRKESMIDRRGSEWLRLSWLVSEAIAHFSGLQIWICDRVDMLDDQNKNSLLKLVQKVRDDYDTILVLGTKGQKPENMPQNDGMKFFWVESGKIR